MVQGRADNFQQEIQIRDRPRTLWERACSRKRCHIQQIRCLLNRFREQARSHRVRVEANKKGQTR
ncbi:hypothetical protein PFAS1_05240 [Pseudomonas frederiksbergensis]|nr:hypothetical protein PFAS1_05240 [Pseudomonas frederiksbergensis]